MFKKIYLLVLFLGIVACSNSSNPPETFLKMPLIMPAGQHMTATGVTVGEFVNAMLKRKDGKFSWEKDKDSYILRSKIFDKATGENFKIVEVFVPVEEKGEKGVLINRVILNGQELSSLEVTQWVMTFVGDILKNKHH